MSQNSTRKKKEHQPVVPQPTNTEDDTPSKGSAPKFTLLRLAQSQPTPLSSYV